MKVKKNIKRYCKVCKKKTEHIVSAAKSSGRSKSHPMSRGSRKRMRRRGIDRGAGNKGRTSKGSIASFKRTGAKVSKKTDLRYKCKVCGKSSVQSHGVRAKKIIFE